MQTPFRHLAEPENLRYHTVSNRCISQILWLLTNPLLVHGMGSKKLKITGWNGYQSGLMVLPTPLMVHRSSQILSKEFLRIKLHLVSHHLVCRPSQFVCQSTVCHHEVFLGGFAIIKCSCILIITPSKFCCFRKSPG